MMDQLLLVRNNLPEGCLDELLLVFLREMGGDKTLNPRVIIRMDNIDRVLPKNLLTGIDPTDDGFNGLQEKSSGNPGLHGR